MATNVFSPRISDDGSIVNRYNNVPDAIRFGLPETSKSGRGFSTPVVIFRFKSPFNNTIAGAPTLYIKAPNSLNLTQLSNYSAAGNIFGGNLDAKGNSIVDYLKASGSNLTDAIARNIITSEQNLRGYIESAGQSGLDQAEFSARSVINPMQQLLYKGPSFKQYNLPFVLRPKNVDEAQAAMDIISAFKIASSPKVTSGSYADPDSNPLFTGSISSVLAGQTPLSFGYPDLVEFEIQMFSGNSNGSTSATKMYESLPCAIQSVSMDYGQQKMAFFIPEQGVEKYYPTEITITLSLQEIAARSVQDAIEESGIETKTLR